MKYRVVIKQVVVVEAEDESDATDVAFACIAEDCDDGHVESEETESVTEIGQ